MSYSAQRLRLQIRGWILFMIFAIVVSGITAFPVETELASLKRYHPQLPPFLADWLSQVYTGIRETNNKYPFLAYGYDWLAFAHLVIAMAFFGPLRDPVKNVWVIDWSILCCVAVFPLALIAGPIRGIPFFHQLIDCAFGLLGLVPLIIVRKKIRRLEQLSKAHSFPELLNCGKPSHKNIPAKL